MDMCNTTPQRITRPSTESLIMLQLLSRFYPKLREKHRFSLALIVSAATRHVWLVLSVIAIPSTVLYNTSRLSQTQSCTLYNTAARAIADICAKPQVRDSMEEKKKLRSLNPYCFCRKIVIRIRVRPSPSPPSSLKFSAFPHIFCIFPVTFSPPASSLVII